MTVAEFAPALERAEPVGERLHALDAVRAFALLLGVVLHSTLAYVMPPGQWGVGAAEVNLPLWAFVHYTHDFRMQLFFLLAGFFAARVVWRRGTRAFLNDRGVRIGLVFIVLLYPIKLLISMPWIAGGLKTGWLRLPATTASLPLPVLAIGAMRDEIWPAISPGHLWFLYYLVLVTAVFLAARWAIQRRPLARVAAALDAAARWISSALAHPLGPIALALPVIPLLVNTPRGVLESPDRGFMPDPTALTIYSLCFAVGWAIQRRPETLQAIGRYGLPWLAFSLMAGAIGFGVEMRLQVGPSSSGLLWSAAIANALTLSLATLGWIGFFAERFSRPSAWVRYLADASYWVYLVHLPIVLTLQVWVSDWGFIPLQLLVINVVTFALSLVTYDLWVRDTPLGAWLNGRRHPRWMRRSAPASKLP